MGAGTGEGLVGDEEVDWEHPANRLLGHTNVHAGFMEHSCGNLCTQLSPTWTVLSGTGAVFTVGNGTVTGRERIVWQHMWVRQFIVGSGPVKTFKVLNKQTFLHGFMTIIQQKYQQNIH